MVELELHRSLHSVIKAPVFQPVSSVMSPSKVDLELFFFSGGKMTIEKAYWKPEP